MKRLHSLFHFLLCILICVCYAADTNAQVIDTTVVLEEEYQDEEIDENFKATVPDTPVVRFIPDSVTNRIRRKKEYAYANDPSFWIKPKQQQHQPGFWEQFDRFLRNSIVRVMFYLLLGSLIVFIVYRLIVNNDLFVRTQKIGDKEAHNLEKDLIDDDELDEKINTAIRVGDHRLAIRFLYIKTLQLLHQKSLIRYHAESTNETYVKQMSQSVKGKDFLFLTQVFEYVWYGEFPLTPEQFETVHRDFRQFHNSVI